MTQQESYRTFTFTSLSRGDTFRYKETHEGLFVEQEDGTWTPSWVFDSIDTVARMVTTDPSEDWEVTWS